MLFIKTDPLKDLHLEMSQIKVKSNLTKEGIHLQDEVRSAKSSLPLSLGRKVQRVEARPASKAN